jgi:hypothetical protein
LCASQRLGSILSRVGMTRQSIVIDFQILFYFISIGVVGVVLLLVIDHLFESRC